MLRSGATGAYAVLGAISAAHHGRAIFVIRCWRREKRASKVTKYLSMYARVEIIAKLRKKNVTASTGIKLVRWRGGGVTAYHIGLFIINLHPQINIYLIESEP